MITTSEQTEKLDAAMAKVLAEVGGLRKDAKNPHFKSSYASLAAIWLVLRPAAQAVGLSIGQHVLESDHGTLRLQTRIAFEGQWIMSVAIFPVTKWDAQGFGSTITYAKRYTLAAIFGLAEDDDDGNTASGKGSQAPDRAFEPVRKPQPPNLAPQAAKPIQKPSFTDQLFEREQEPGPTPGMNTKIKDWPQTDPHGEHVVRFGKNTGKRISDIKSDDLKAMIAWVDGKKAEKAQVAKNVQEAYDHAIKFLES